MGYGYYVGCFEVKDNGDDGEKLAAQINAVMDKMKDRYGNSVTAKDIISIVPGKSGVIRIFYRTEEDLRMLKSRPPTSRESADSM